MKNIHRLLLPAFIGLVVYACAPKAAESAPAADSTAVATDTVSAIDQVSSSAARVNPADKTHQFVRTAELRFRVNNVVTSTYDIENTVAAMGGFVTNTELSSHVTSTESLRWKNDSLVEISKFTVVNTITIRVPNTKLDSTLKLIARNICFLDSRTIKADDVSLQLLSNSLAVKRGADTQNRLAKAIDHRGRKLAETTDAEQLLADKQEQADNARINNLSLRDQINYSTVNIYMYQRESIKREIIPDLEHSSRYQPGFFSRIADGLYTGWSILVTFVVFLANSWSVILLLVGLYFLYRLLTRRKNKSDE